MSVKDKEGAKGQVINLRKEDPLIDNSVHLRAWQANWRRASNTQESYTLHSGWVKWAHRSLSLEQSSPWELWKAHQSSRSRTVSYPLRKNWWSRIKIKHNEDNRDTGKRSQRKLRKQATIFFNTTLKQERIGQLQLFLLKVHIRNVKNEQQKSIRLPLLDCYILKTYNVKCN